MICFNPKLYCYKYDPISEHNLFVLGKSRKLFWEYVSVKKVKKLFGKVYLVEEKKISQANWFLPLEVITNLTPLEKINLEIESLDKEIRDYISATGCDQSPVVTTRRKEVQNLIQYREYITCQDS